MTEEKVKKRGWVKNAAIIFLAVMLVLTYFSNTIMNLSLPEVAYKYPSSGSITARIRGTGTVEAVESYEVSIAQTREVESVHVKVGDTVTTGDTLFVLSDTDSTELENAQSELENLNLQYQKALINLSEADYARENRDIRLAREELEDAERKRNENQVSALSVSNAKAAVTAAKTAVKAAEDNVTSCQKKVTDAQNDLSNAGGGGGGYTNTEIQQKKNEIAVAEGDLEAAKTELNVAMIAYAGYYSALRQEAETAAGAGASEEQIKLQMAALSEQYAGAKEGEQGYGWNKAYTAITAAENKVATLTTKLNGLNAELSAMQGQSVVDSSDSYYRDRLETAQNNLQKAQDKLKDAQDNQTELEDKLKELEDKEAEYDAAVEKVKTCRRSLEDLLFELEQQQKTDDKTQALERLDLEKLRSDIADQQRLVSKYRGETVESVVTAKVNGVIRSIAVSAGNSTMPNEAMAVIEVVDRGYSLKIPVTTEQSRKVTIGDSAEISGNYYWGSQISATLVAVKNDPQNPGSGRLLEFSVSGEVDSGSTLNVSIGERSQNYGTIVPNSAVRSDMNGDFVLVVVTKSTPLGNRYTATRADVQVLAKDDENSAISGGLTNYDFVITTSSKPIEPGMYVKMPDSF